MKIQDLFSKEVITLFSNNEMFDEVIHNIKNNRLLFKEVHYKYIFMRNNKIIFDEVIMRKIIIMHIIYLGILKEDELNSKVLPIDIVEEKVKNKILSMKTIDDIDSFYKYYRDMCNVINDSSVFSLEEQYKNLLDDSLPNELNGVALITPVQTISRYNSSSVTGEYGTGYHEDNFNDILHCIYGREFECNYSGQDIKVRFVNFVFKNSQFREMTLEIPLPINSSQKASLISLDESIKKLINRGIEVNIEVSIIQDNGTTYYNEQCETLDEVLDLLVINDFIDYEYTEEFFIGENNFDAEYIKSKKIKYKF